VARKGTGCPLTNKTIIDIIIIVNRQTVYRLEALLELAHAYPESVPVAELARRRRIPRAFLARLLTELARAGVVHTVRGPRGGVSLARPPEAISLATLLPPEEGPVLGGAAVRRVSATLAAAQVAALAPLSLAALVGEEQRAGGAVDFEI